MFVKLIKNCILTNNFIFIVVSNIYAKIKIGASANVKIKQDKIEITSKNNKYILPINKNAYTFEVLKDFSFYINAVEPEIIENNNIFDFSIIKKHKLKYENKSFYYYLLPEIPETDNIYLAYLNLHKNDVVLDIGSFSGHTAYKFSEAIGNDGLVISIESDPTNFELLQKNIKNLGLSNIKTINKALWKKSTTLEFLSEGSMCSTLNILNNLTRKHQNILKIQTTTLEEIVQDYNLNKIDAIKIDIEGAEYDVFANISPFLEKYKPLKFIIEIHPNANGKTDVNYFKRILNSHNYKCQMIKITDNSHCPMLFAKLSNQNTKNY